MAGWGDPLAEGAVERPSGGDEVLPKLEGTWWWRVEKRPVCFRFTDLMENKMIVGSLLAKSTCVERAAIVVEEFCERCNL